MVCLNKPSQRHFSRNFFTRHLGKFPFGMKYLYSLSPARTSRFPLNTVEVRRNLMFLAEWMSAFAECPHSTQQNSSCVCLLRSSMQPQWPHIFDVYSAYTSEISKPYMGAMWMNSSFNDESPILRCNRPRLKPLLSSE